MALYASTWGIQRRVVYLPFSAHRLAESTAALADAAVNCLPTATTTVIADPGRGHDADRNSLYERDRFLCEMAEGAGSVLAIVWSAKL